MILSIQFTVYDLNNFMQSSCGFCLIYKNDWEKGIRFGNLNIEYYVPYPNLQTFIILLNETHSIVVVMLEKLLSRIRVKTLQNEKIVKFNTNTIIFQMNNITCEWDIIW